MSVPVALRLCPFLTADDLLRHDEVTHEEMFQRGSLRMLKGEVPVLVDHEPERVIGRVLDIYTAPDWGGGEWFWAQAVLDDPPGWVRKDLGCSISFATTRRQEMPGGWTRVLEALLTEVSSLTPANSPAHRRARVVWVGQDSPSGLSSDRLGGEVIPGDGRTIRRYFDSVPITVRDGSGQVIVSRGDGSQVIYGSEADYQAQRSLKAIGRLFRCRDQTRPSHSDSSLNSAIATDRPR